MAKNFMPPISLQLGYQKWDDNWSTKLKRLPVGIKKAYVSISDEGTARFSQRAAEEFAKLLIDTITSGTTGVKVKGTKDNPDRTGTPVGIRTGEMVDSITWFRTNLQGEKKHRGWVVGIKEKVQAEQGDYPLYYRLSWLEYGTSKQVPRPVFKTVFERYIGSGEAAEAFKKRFQEQFMRMLETTINNAGSLEEE